MPDIKGYIYKKNKEIYLTRSTRKPDGFICMAPSYPDGKPVRHIDVLDVNEQEKTAVLNQDKEAAYRLERKKENQKARDFLINRNLKIEQLKNQIPSFDLLADSEKLQLIKKIIEVL